MRHLITSILGRFPDGHLETIPVFWSIYARPAVAVIGGRTFRQTARRQFGRWLYAADPDPLVTDTPLVVPDRAVRVDLTGPMGLVATIWMRDPIPATAEWNGVPVEVHAQQP